MKIKIILICAINFYQIWAQLANIELNVPALSSEDLKVETANNKGYEFSLSLPNSQWTEFISLDNLVVEGLITTYFPEDGSNLIINYVADKNGYRASLKFSSLPSPVSAVGITPRLSSNDLKTLAG